MKYKFPTINDISEVRAAISGRTDFIECRKEDYIVFNYVIATPDTFPPVEGWKNAMLRECRGLIFNAESGKCIRRPYHKFFNFGEREETMELEPEFQVLEKLDGSMIAPFYSNGKIRWGTKMGVTDLTRQVEEFVAKHPQYEKFAFACLQTPDLPILTPIFEWCSNKNRIVLPYEEDKLILTAVRDNVTGKYWFREKLKLFSKDYKIPLVQEFESFSHEALKQAKGVEGVVLNFADGHKIKVKSDWYVDLHKTKEAISSERFVIKLILSNMVDDIIPKLQPEDVKKLVDYQRKIVNNVEAYAEIAHTHADRICTTMDRKQFAIGLSSLYSPDVKSFIFKRYDNPQLSELEYFTDFVLRNTGCNKNLKSVEHIYGYHKWDYYNE